MDRQTYITCGQTDRHHVWTDRHTSRVDRQTYITCGQTNTHHVWTDKHTSRVDRQTYITRGQTDRHHAWTDKHTTNSVLIQSRRDKMGDRELGREGEEERERKKILTRQTESVQSQTWGAYVLPALDDPVWACPGETRPSSVTKHL